MFIFGKSFNKVKLHIMNIIKTFVLLLIIGIGFSSAAIAGSGYKGIKEKDPAINSVDPDIGHIGQTLTVTISGQSNNFTQGTNMIWFEQGTSTIYAYNYVPVNDTVVHATIDLPFAPEGYYDVGGHNSVSGTFEPLENGFLLKGFASLISMTPTSGMLGTEVNITIAGENTSFVSANELIAALIKDSDTLYLSANAADETTIIASVLIPYSANTGYYDLYVYNNYDAGLFLFNAFNVEVNPVSPEITSVSPDSILVDNVSQVTVNCLNTHFAITNNTEVWLTMGSDSIVASSVTINSTTQLVVSFNTYGAATGFWDLNISDDDDGHFILYEGIEIYKVSGIDEVFNIPNLNIYPNPCFDYLNISGQFPKNEFISIRIIDINGKEIIRTNENSEKLKSYSINLSGLKNGIYFIQFSDNKRIVSRKILKVAGK